MGLAAFQAENGAQAIKCLPECRPHLILSDISMPELDGYELCRIVKADARTRDIPIIFISAFDGMEDIIKGFELGGADYITKPFHPVIVKARVNTHVKLYRYRKQVEEQSMTDQLTGIANRRKYERCSREKWFEAVRLKAPFSICMFDIDNFKKYNDTFGHPAGDRVIAAVAKAASDHFRRSTDFFARYGGEEFVAISIGESSEKMFGHLKKIRQAVEDLHIPHDPAVSEWVTISIGGVTTVPAADSAYDFYLQIADTMLYDAKKNGRNRVVWADERMKQLWEK